MTETSALTYVGAPDPELRNSPIISETDEDFESSGQEIDELPLCYFNGVGYRYIGVQRQRRTAALREWRLDT